MVVEELVFKLPTVHFWSSAEITDSLRTGWNWPEQS